jgi:hypothetical protein
MDSTVIALAKTMVVFDAKDLDSVIASCEQPALIMLQSYADSEKLSLYLNSFDTTYSSTELGDTEFLTKLNLNSSMGIAAGSVIQIPVTAPINYYSGIYVVESVTDNAIQIRKTFTISNTGTITNTENNAMLYAHAYLILKLFALHAQSIVKGDVIYSSQQFGQGSMSPASISEKKFLADNYHNQAMRMIGTIRGLTV